MRTSSCRVTQQIFACALSFCFVAVSSNPLGRNTLRCCTLLQTPLVVQDKHRKPYAFKGIAIEYLRNLEDELDFKCSPLSLFPTISDDATGFNKFIKRMQDCTENGQIKSSDECECDIGVAGFRLNEERYRSVNFLPQFLSNDFRVLTHIDNTHASSGSAFFFTVFHPTLWLAICALFFTFVFVKYMDKNFSSPSTDFVPMGEYQPRFKRWKHYLLKSKVLYRLRKATQSVASNVVNIAPDPTTASSTRQWVLNFCIALCGLILILAYDAVMTASLMQETYTSDYRTIADFKGCRIAPEEVCLPKGGAVEAFWDTSIAKGEECHEQNDGPLRYTYYDEGFKMAARKECRYLLALGSAIEAATQGRYCGQLVKTGLPFFEGGVSFILPYGSNLTNVISEATLRLGEHGELTTMDQFLPKQGVSCEEQHIPSLSLKKLQVFFIAAFAVCLLIFLEIIFDPTLSSLGNPSAREGKGRNNGKDEASRTSAESNC